MSERWTNTANDKGELSEMLIQSLIETAVKQLRFSYTPYSHFKVGAALLAADGTIYTGCNIENAAYTPTNCAERTAIFKDVSEGVRDFRAICIVGGMNGVPSGYTAPLRCLPAGDDGISVIRDISDYPGSGRRQI